ncbi:acetyltransferase [Pedobacter sp. ASV1-7]|uniref:acetyltransferase n=1 Tax=Pedobacter sp. ASV1-7 TaxID=3145237 RepID=UPI0032E89122
MKQKLILIGGGGHCKACIDVVEQSGNFEIAGILDEKNLIGQSVLDYMIVGTDADIPKYVGLGCSFLITVGQIKSAEIRKNLFKYLMDCKADIATVISPRAYISRYAEVGTGTIVMHNVTINAGARIGTNCILNTGCNIEHDTLIGSNVHVSTLATVNGNCEVGNEVFIGSNATISSQMRISENTIIGAGTVVVRAIKEKGIYVGNPAKKIN